VVAQVDIEPGGYSASLDSGTIGRFVRSTVMEKHELSKIDFEIIENAFNALLQSRPDPLTANKISDLRDMFRDPRRTLLGSPH
jgi:hypothetical protein